MKFWTCEKFPLYCICMFVQVGLFIIFFNDTNYNNIYWMILMGSIHPINEYIPSVCVVPTSSELTAYSLLPLCRRRESRSGRRTVMVLVQGKNMSESKLRGLLKRIEVSSA